MSCARTAPSSRVTTSYVDELNSVDVEDLDPAAAPPLMCLVVASKGGMGADERVSVGMIVISPSTGDVVWDEFEGMAITAYAKFYPTQKVFR